MDVLLSASRQGVQVEVIQHALRNAVVVEEIAEDPTRYLVLGAEPAGRLLEPIVMDRPHGPAVIHAMPTRPKYGHLLLESR